MPVVNAIKSWLAYADKHAERYVSKVGDDGVLGLHWAAWGFALRGLLNGETGRLDCGTLDTILCETLEAEDFNVETGDPFTTAELAARS